MQVDQDTLAGSWKPVIVADGPVCREICTLESEIERAGWIAGRVAEGHGFDESVVVYCAELARVAEEEDVTRFLHELGWFFQRSCFRSLNSSLAHLVSEIGLFSEVCDGDFFEMAGCGTLVFMVASILCRCLLPSGMT